MLPVWVCLPSFFTSFDFTFFNPFALQGDYLFLALEFLELAVEIGNRWEMQ